MKRAVFIWLAFAAAAVVAFIADLMIGSASIPPGEIVKILFGSSAEKPGWENIVMQIRLPRVLTAVAIGAALPVSGLLMQTMFRNPLAGPYILGLSSGASLGVALLVLTAGGVGAGTALAGMAQGWAVILAAIIGAVAVMLLVLAVSFRVGDVMTLLIVGLMVASTTSAIVSVLQYWSERQALQSFVFWTFGSLKGVDWTELKILFPIAVVGIGVAVILSKWLNGLLLGESYAQSLGINVKRLRVAIILVTALLAGSATAFCGPIAFIGLAVPHIARLLLRTTNHLVLIPGAALIGILVMLVCDMISQVPEQDISLPINAVTSLLGAPVVIWIVLSRKNVGGYF